MSSWRPAVRIARRDALRHRARSVSVLVMIGLPVAGVVAADVVLRTQDVSSKEQVVRQLGAADALLMSANGGRPLFQQATGDGYGGTGSGPRAGSTSTDDVRRVLGPGARVITLTAARVPVLTRIGLSYVAGTEVDLTDPMTRGLFSTVRGRLPARTGEVLVSRRLAARGFGVGATLRVDGGPARAVVGVADSPQERDVAFAVGLPGGLDIDPRTVLQQQFLVAQPGGVRWSDVRALNHVGVVVRSRYVVSHPPAASEVDPRAGTSSDGGIDGAVAGVIALVVLMALLEVALLAGPAFAVGARQRRHQLALMAASGAQPRDLRRSVLALGVVLGGAGAVLGVIVGVGAARLAVPLVQRTSDQRFGPFEVAPLDVLAIAAFGLLSAVLAAAAPAWVAARQDVVAVLAGRRGDAPAGARSPLAGVGLMALGVAGAAAGARSASGGAIVAVATLFLVIGMVLIVPAVISLLARLCGALPLPLRFAVRDAARNRSRTTPAVAAVAATVVGVTALGIASASDTSERRHTYTPSYPRGVAVVASDSVLSAKAIAAARTAIPGASVRVIDGVPGVLHHALRFSGSVGTNPFGANSSYGTFVIVTDHGVGALGLGLPASAAREGDRTVAAGGAVVFAAGRPGADTTSVRSRGRPSVTAPAMFVSPGDGRLYSPVTAVIAPSLAKRLGVRVRPTGALLSGVPITQRREDDLSEAMAAAQQDAGVIVERGYDDGPGKVVLLVLGVVGAVLMLGGTLTATFLALADARADLSTLAAVGADPRARRSIAAAYAATVAVVGGVLGAAVGFVPGVAAGYSVTDTTGFGVPGLPAHFVDVPWLLIGGVLVVLPLVAALSVACVSRSRGPLAGRVG